MPWQVWFGLNLVIASMVIFAVQIAIFHNIHDTGFHFLQDLAFVPIEVLLITLLLHRLLSIREKRVLMTKMNMLIGVFFSEVGIKLAGNCFAFDHQAEALKKIISVEADWNENQFREASEKLNKHIFRIDAKKGDLAGLKLFLTGKRQTLSGLLANPNLLEHDTFTALMRAVFHLTEELEYRPSLDGLPAADYAHLGVDIGRAYRLLGQEWLAYMKYLQKDYPYLFSLAVRSNPFNDQASVIIKDAPDNKSV
ncbi:MAG: hypothetical protein H6Q65_618 [Firmicutes bacterium]|nr:hypothetical protein [Bacillota bacterium]